MRSEHAIGTSRADDLEAGGPSETRAAKEGQHDGATDASVGEVAPSTEIETKDEPDVPQEEEQSAQKEVRRVYQREEKVQQAPLNALRNASVIHLVPWSASKCSDILFLHRVTYPHRTPPPHPPSPSYPVARLHPPALSPAWHPPLLLPTNHQVLVNTCKKVDSGSSDNFTVAEASDGTEYLVKIVASRRRSNDLEDAVYRGLEEEHPGIAPCYVGRFVVNQAHSDRLVRDIIILERRGLRNAWPSTDKEKAHYYDLVRRLYHEVGLELPSLDYPFDISTRHVFLDKSLLEANPDANPFRLVGFDTATHHVCPGAECCHGLVGLKCSLGPPSPDCGTVLPKLMAAQRQRMEAQSRARDLLAFRACAGNSRRWSTGAIWGDDEDAPNFSQLEVDEPGPASVPLPRSPPPSPSHLLKSFADPATSEDVGLPVDRLPPWRQRNKADAFDALRNASVIHLLENGTTCDKTLFLCRTSFPHRLPPPHAPFPPQPVARLSPPAMPAWQPPLLLPLDHESLVRGAHDLGQGNAYDVLSYWTDGGYGEEVAVKLPRPGGALYAFEDAIYRRLEEHPGIAPAYLGRFVLHQQHPEYCSRDVLILERWGKQIDSFSELKRDERVHIFDLAKRLHLEVKLKLDIRPRNVLRPGGQDRQPVPPHRL